MSVMTVKEKIAEDLVPSLISGGLALGIFTLGMGHSLSEQVPIFGMDVPAFAPVFGVAMASHLVGNVLEDHVLTLFQSQDSARKESVFIKPAIAGASSYLLYSMLTPDAQFTGSFVAGALPVITSDYISNAFLKKNY